jgi:hypothetical protein
MKEKEDFINILTKIRNDLEKDVMHLMENVELKNEDLLRADFVLIKIIINIK